MVDSPHQLTLWLWLEGLFPRRITYLLLMKGVVSSPADLLQAKTKDPNLRIVTVKPDLANGLGWVSTPADDPLPVGHSTPCLRVTDPDTGLQHFIRESSSIMTYLEELYSGAEQGFPRLTPTDGLDLGATNDRISLINLAFADGGTYLIHASPFLAQFQDLKDEDRSLGAARFAKGAMVKKLVKLQSWAEQDLRTTGWLSPGLAVADGKAGASQPGLVDIALAGCRRYIELSYAWDLFEQEELKPLAEWYERFKATVPWWKELEERDDVHPKEMTFGKESREV